MRSYFYDPGPWPPHSSHRWDRVEDYCRMRAGLELSDLTDEEAARILPDPKATWARLAARASARANLYWQLEGE